MFSQILKKVLNNSHSRLMSTVSHKLKYSQHGEPAEVLSLCKEEISDPVDHEVLVKILASPINPADINIIQGKYPVKPEFPATGGNESIGEVIHIGNKVETLQVGDRVISFSSNLGTWASYVKFTEENFMKVSSKIGIPEAATLYVNPCTAYRMLKDFVNLHAGDVVIQNGANSAVGQAVHQLCKAWNISSVGIVRNRPEIDNLKKYLKELGATEVLTEEEIRKTDIFKTTLRKPKLALNCVGGKSATEITRHLEQKGILVTYGGMAREPVIAPTAALIFKDISFNGFWMTRWSQDNFSTQERFKMFDELSDLIERGQFKAPTHEMVPVADFKRAMNDALNFKGFTGKKFILDFQDVPKC